MKKLRQKEQCADTLEIRVYDTFEMVDNPECKARVMPRVFIFKKIVDFLLPKNTNFSFSMFSRPPTILLTNNPFNFATSI